MVWEEVLGVFLEELMQTSTSMKAVKGNIPSGDIQMRNSKS
jgi:hypothetical protein